MDSLTSRAMRPRPSSHSSIYRFARKFIPAAKLTEGSGIGYVKAQPLPRTRATDSVSSRPPMNLVPHIPALRRGQPYESLDRLESKDHRTGETRATISQVNAGVVRKDLHRIAESRAA